MADPTPQKPFGDPVSVLKPNIPDCWSPQLTISVTTGGKTT